MAAPTIAFITTCKSRLMHVKETMPTFVAARPDEIVFVDYGCPQKSGDWVEANHPGVKVVRIDDDLGFCAARARNAGAAACTAEWLCFIDADIRIGPGWAAWLRENADPNHHWRAARLPDGQRDPETWGTTMCARSVFERIGGYDEVFRGWGGEDEDLYQRLTLGGIPEANYPKEFVNAIGHDDALRFVHHELKDRSPQMLVNRLYRDMKLSLSMGRPSNEAVPLATRRGLMEEVGRAVKAMAYGPEAKSRAISVDLTVTASFGEQFSLVKKANFSFQLKRKDLPS